MQKSPDSIGLKCHNGTCKKQHHYYQGFTFRLYVADRAVPSKNLPRRWRSLDGEHSIKQGQYLGS